MKEGWKCAKLGSLCSVRRDSGQHTDMAYIGLEHIASEKGKLITIATTENVIGSTNLFSRGDVLYGKLRPYLKKVVVAETEGCCSTEILPIKCGEHILPDFLKYWFLEDNASDRINDTCGGCRMPRANMKQVFMFDFYYPSLSEQQRIVDILDAEFAKIDALKENAEKNLQNAKDLFQAVLRKELEPKEGWKTQTIGDVCEVQGGATPKRTERLFWENGTYPWFTVDDIREQGRIITDTKQKITELAWNKSRVFPKNTVLLCCTASVGEYAITTIPLTSNQQFNGLTIKKGVNIHPMFLFYYASTLKETLLKLSGKATIDFVSGAKVKAIKISYPLSLDEQGDVISKLEYLEKMCFDLQKSYKRTIDLCSDLKQALLRKAFNGEL